MHIPTVNTFTKKTKKKTKKTQQPKFKRKVGVIMFTRFLLMPAAAATMLLLGSRAGLIPVSTSYILKTKCISCVCIVYIYMCGSAKLSSALVLNDKRATSVNTC
jgi:hypothetical protein